MNRIAWLLLLGPAAGVVGMAVACGSSGNGSAAPCTFDAAASFDANGDTGPGPGTDAGLACEAGSIPSMGQCMNVAGTLAGLRWELPCTMPGSPYCPTEFDGGDVQVVSTTLGGAAGQTYAVTLHFRGVVEMKAYFGDDAGGPRNAGAVGLAHAQFFVSGGVDDGDGANLYELAVSDPPGVYFLNSAVPFGSNVWWLDYEATVPMKSGATVTLTANAKDSLETANINGIDGGPVFVPGVPPYPSAFDGQFIQMDVVSVVVMP
ncbi:MAG TPA: hypothetical protein VF765_08470 [Polyangiaceae bacterium]